MKISRDEQNAIKAVLLAGEKHGFGNMVCHLKTGWARTLVAEGFTEADAIIAAGGDGYPFAMQEDLVTRGEWDETGERYRAHAKKGKKRCQ